MLRLTTHSVMSLGLALAWVLIAASAACADTTTLTSSNQSVVAGPAPTTLDFPITRSGDTAYPAVVSYRTVDGTAAAGVDYQAASGTVSFAVGATDATIPITIAAHAGAGPALTFNFNLDGAVGLGPTAAFPAPQTLDLAGINPNPGPFAVATPDLNGDGIPDLVIADYFTDAVSVLLNTTLPGATTASFAPQQTFATGSGPQSVAAADINGDGRPDLIVADRGEAKVSVLLNTTALPNATMASFSAHQDFNVGSGPISVAVGDVNGDGRADVVAANNSAGNVSVLLNTTTPGATAPSFAAQLPFAAASSPGAVALADVNGDGKADLIVTNNNSANVSVLLNTTVLGTLTTPAFATHQDFATGTSPIGVTSADLDNDGRADLIVGNYDSPSSLSVLLNRTPPGAATSNFTSQQTYGVAAAPYGVVAADLNGDGKVDLIATSQNTSQVSVLLNNTAFGAGAPTFAPQQNVDAGATSTGIATGDLNGDGRADLVTANVGGSASVLLNTTAPLGVATPKFATLQPFAAQSFAHAVVAGDFNGDGRPDLAVANAGSSGTVSVLLDTSAPCAAPTFTAQQTFAVGPSPFSIAAPDLNGDGRPDLVTGNFTDATASVRLDTTAAGAPLPTFGAHQTFATGAATTHPQGVAAADINGDGKPDLVVANLATFTVLLNTTAPGDTSASFAAFQSFDLPAGAQGYSVVAPDLNGDGRPDVVIADYNTPAALVWLNATAPDAATVSFAPGAPQTHPTRAGTHAVAVASADVNSDGRRDLIATNYPSTGPGPTNSVSVLLNFTGPGATATAFGTQQPFASGNYPFSVAAADLDGDGRADIVVGNYFDATVSVLINTTSPGATLPSFAAQQTFGASSTPYSVAATDVNGDGKADLAVASSGSASVLVLLNAQYLCRFVGNPAVGTITPDAVFADGFE